MKTVEQLLAEIRAHYARPYCARPVVTPAAPEGDGRCGLREGHTGPCINTGVSGA